MFGSETHDKLDRILHLQHATLFILQRTSRFTEQELQMIDQEVQTALDKIRQTQSLAQSIVAADKLRDQQIADLKAQIAAIPVGTALSAEDKAALVDTANAIDDVNAALASAIPANTNIGSGSVGVPPASSDETNPDGSPKPQPLAGTGDQPQMPGVPVAAPAAPAPAAAASTTASPLITPAI